MALHRDWQERLIQAAQTKPLLDPHHTPEQSRAAIEALLLTLTTTGARELLQRAWRIAPYPPEITPITDADQRLLRAHADEHAIFGLGYSREETSARVEDWLATPRTRADYNDFTQGLDYRTPHPTAQTGIPLAAIDGIATPTFSEGHYAVFVDSGTSPGTATTAYLDDTEMILRFYRIYTPTHRGYTGGVVIRRYASDNGVAITPTEARAVIDAINTDPDTAAYRYSDHYSNCWVCGRSLTDAISRLLSVGPTCRGFNHHQGLRAAGNEVDRNPERRAVYRALRTWALSQGYTDPVTREDRERRSTNITAALVASAWSGIPGILAMGETDAVAVAQDAISGNPLAPATIEAIHQAPADTVCALIDAGFLSIALLTALIEHPSRTVKKRATDYFADALAAD